MNPFMLLLGLGVAWAIFGDDDAPEGAPPGPAWADRPFPPIRVPWRNLGKFSPHGEYGRTHEGVDMAVPMGTPIYAIGRGRVTSVTVEGDGKNDLGGTSVVTDHEPGEIGPHRYRTYNAHLSGLAVKPGDVIDANTVLGFAGNTGNARGTDVHLHFELRRDGKLIDPEEKGLFA